MSYDVRTCTANLGRSFSYIRLLFPIDIERALLCTSVSSTLIGEN